MNGVLVEIYPHGAQEWLVNWMSKTALKNKYLDFKRRVIRGTQRQFSENICSEDDLRSRNFGTFVLKFLACLGFSNI